MITENNPITDKPIDVADSVQLPAEIVQQATEPVEPNAEPEPGTEPAPAIVADETQETTIPEATAEPVQLPVVIPETPEKKPGKKEAAAKPAKAPTRATRTVAFSIEEDEYIQQIFEARHEAGLSENMNQMLRQALNFAFNHEPGWVFGVPKNIKKIHFVK